MLSKNINVVILSHFLHKTAREGQAAPHNIRNYLLNKVGKIVYIEHPFPGSNFPYSQMIVYKNGKESYQVTTPKLIGPQLLQYLIQIFITFFFLVRSFSKYDICFALDDLSVLAVLPFKAAGFIKRLIYYSIDYTPQRFPNKLTNHLYHFADRIASYSSDINWVAVENIVDAKKNNGLSIAKAAPFKVVPIGYEQKNIKLKPVSRTNRFNLAFVGTLYEKQGLQLVISVLPRLIKQYPKLHLTVVGAGEYENQLRSQIKKFRLIPFVTFTGFISNHQEIVEILTKSSIGLATYSPALGNFTYFADPSKIKLYLLCGLPVIVTDVPAIAQTISKRKAGIVVEYIEDDIYQALNKLLASKKTYTTFRNSAIHLSKDYDIDLILSKAIKDII